jgi:hypothetical protein
LQEAQDFWCGIGPKAGGFVYRLAGPEMPGSRYDDRAREVARLLQSGEELFPLRYRIDDIVFAGIESKRNGCHFCRP